MKSRFDQALDSDSTPSRTAAERYRADRDEPRNSLALLTYRGGVEELQIGLEYSRSPDAGDRIVGAHILGQLGWSDQTFLNESVTRLTEMLVDPDLPVISAAATALGHREAPGAIPHLLKIAAHPDASVRLGVVFGLTGYEDPEVIRTLITLAKDEDTEVRNWAVFGLGSQIETDSAGIRGALVEALNDEDPEIRGEALVGLAIRNHPSARRFLLDEIRRDEEISYLAAEAALTIDERFPDFRESSAHPDVDRAALIAALEESLAKENASRPPDA